ncbi:hypothetical protein [Streptomyces sp. PR69]|uniref:hypothetical protein n=1 Tax=Streptomyces sp. PR69 TaxID=2984950 RepID=UPI002264FD26|nr:hypothetical protein [Streptomyces sp. PR69]
MRITLAPVPAEPEPRPSRWAWLTRYVRPWKAIAALTLAVAPVPGVGHSAGAVWAYTVSLARDEYGIPHAYALAGIPLLLAGTAVVRRGTLPAVFALAVCAIGVTGAMNWYDPITALTGVRP